MLSPHARAADPAALQAAVWGPRPDWSMLDAFAYTRTPGEVRALLDEVYAPDNAAVTWLSLTDNALIVQTGDPNVGTIRIPLATGPSQRRPAPQFWRHVDELQLGADPEKPLQGLRLVIDPGHIGGDWASLEAREWQLPGGPVMREGEIALAVAREARAQLQRLGAKVYLVRARNQPVTPYRPEDFYPLARYDLQQRGTSSPTDAQVRHRAELYFYRYAEIRARAELINDRMQPDLVVALHLNAAAWPDPDNPALVEQDHAHVLLHGAYSAAELKRPLARLEMLEKLMTGVIGEELRWGEPLAASLEAETHLPAFTYTGSNAVKVGAHPYLWARNLLANRIYHCPVVYLEPYVLNSAEVYGRLKDVQAEDLRESDLVQEYARALVKGLLKAADSAEN